ncbi:MAG: histidine--tRNA ligase [Firmicutes bacterium]|nr:histidine--tRNA ligase [Bacillota bacterium]
MLTTAPRGTRDILPEEAAQWQYVESNIRQCCLLYGYGEIRPPLFEHTELFLRSVGETTDIVEKEMYTFRDRGGRNITLRPEATASTVRAYLEHNLYAGPQPVKMYYLGPMFRYDRPQAGRYRQFSQFGIEAIGTQDPTMDAEVISVALDFYCRLGLTGLEVQLNSIGCPKCRQDYRQALLNYLSQHRGQLCRTCLSRLDRNPLRVLDCKEEGCQAITADAPRMLTYLCSECDEHFKAVQECLQSIEAHYVINPALVRGLDYYTKTVFEIVWPGLGAQAAICGGGRYDGLIEECGGPSTPAVGFAMGLDRVLLAIQKAGAAVPAAKTPLAYVVALSAADNQEAFRILTRLRRADIISDKDYRQTSLRAQLKAADRSRARYAVLVGGIERTQGMVAVRNMTTGEQHEIPLDQLITFLQEGR